MNTEPFKGPIEEYPAHVAEHCRNVSDLLDASANILHLITDGMAKTKHRDSLVGQADVLQAGIDTLKRSAADFVLRLLQLEAINESLKTEKS